ncbi:Protease Do-like 7 [Linum perenne]
MLVGNADTLRTNTKITTNFLTLESFLDDCVDQNVELEIERGDKTLSLNIMVQDLNAITPDHFLEVSGAIIHTLSYQQARNFRFPCGIVYVSDPGYILERAGVPRFAIIKKLSSVETPTMKEFIETLHKLPKGARVPLEYITYNRRHKTTLALITIDNHEWFGSPKIYTRNDCSGLWNIVPAFPSDYGETNSTPLLSNASTISADNGITTSENASSEFCDNNTVTSFSTRTFLEPSLVMCEVSIPSVCMTDGVHGKYYNGLGLIIHHSKTLGLIVVDRNTVPIFACDILLYFASCPVQISGQVVYLHPVHNYAILSYNPTSLGAEGTTMVRAAQLLSDQSLCHGDSVFLVSLTEHLGAISKKAIVTNPFCSLHVNSAEYPHYKARNIEVIELDSDFGDNIPGILCNEFGKVQALWGSFYTELESGNMMKNQITRGIPIYLVSQVLEKMLYGSTQILVNENTRLSMPLVRVLEVEFFPRSLSRARNYGLTDYWIKTLLKKDPVRKHVLRVISCSAGSKAANHLIEGDMLLAINGKPVTSYLDIENACEELDKINAHDEDANGKLSLTIFRQGCEVSVEVETDIRDGNGTRRVINWSGCIIQETHPAVRAFGYLPQQGHGVYITTWFTGCPAERYNIWGGQWIVEVNGKMTPNLDVFLDVVKELDHDEFVRIKTINLEGKPQVSTLKQDLCYWPTEELIFDPNTTTWRRHTVKAFA